MIARSRSDAAGQEVAEVAGRGVVVVVQRDVVDVRRSTPPGRSPPSSRRWASGCWSCRRRRARRAGSSRRIARAASAATPAVLGGGLVADLPRAVHLVAQAPDLDPVRLLGAVRAAQVGELRCPRDGCSTPAARPRPRRPGCRGSPPSSARHRPRRTRRRTRRPRTRWARSRARRGRAGEGRSSSGPTPSSQR